MKYCACLVGDPPGLAKFRADNPQETDWETFRQGGRERYSELADALTLVQRGLCAFCEAPLFTEIPTPVRQIEHWLPKSNAGDPLPDISFSVANFHACCLGGAKPHLSPPFGTMGLVGDNVSCGQKKGDVSPEDLPTEQRPYRPTELPLSPPIFTVDLDGTLLVNPDAVQAGLSTDRIAATITFLGLNCDRLRLSREAVRTYLDDRLAEYEAAEAAGGDPMEAIRSAMRRLASELGPKPGATLPAFITVLRDFFGPANEATLLTDQNWAVG